MSFRLKTILGVGLIESVLLLVLISSSMVFLRESSEQELMRYSQTTSMLFATSTKDALISYDLASLSSALEELLKNAGVVFARVVDADGVVLVESGSLERMPVPFLPNTSIAAVDDGVLDASSRVEEGGEYFGEVQLGFDTGQIQLAVDTALSRTSSIALIELVLVALFSFALGLYLTNQLKVLVLASHKVASGELDYKISVKGKDEVAQVATAFNTMTDALEETDKARAAYRAQLEQLNAELEERVLRRTEMLEKQNVELQLINDQLISTQKQLVQSEKMASVGQLAAGVAHEINNPVGFVASNLSTLKQYGAVYQKFIGLSLGVCQEILQSSDEMHHPKAELINSTARKISDLAKSEDIEFINEDLGMLIEESLDGAHRVSDIVAGLKSFSHESSR